MEHHHETNGSDKNNKRFLILIVIVLAFVWYAFPLVRAQISKQEPQNKVTPQPVEEKKQFDEEEYTVKSGDTLDTILQQFNVSPAERLKVFDAAKDVYDLANLRTGQVLRIISTATSDDMVRLEYEYDGESILIVERDGQDFVARQEAIEYDIEIARADGEITSSLFASASEAGVEDGVIMEITDILAWEVDFVSDIRVGDSFKIVYEKRFRDGEYADYGRILGVMFTNQGNDYWAIYYEDPNGNKGYYDREGNSTKKAFLKSPLQYKYISSGYTNSRLHPVLKKYLPHRAIDYAAKSGTPVAAVGSGRVTYAGRKGGDGIFVEIKHNNSYITRYSHLRGIAKGIKVGSRVEQNDIIGYVGSTGFSTGPHLQYAMLKNNTPVNPLTIDLPSGDPVPDEFMNDFMAVVREVESQMNN